MNQRLRDFIIKLNQHGLLRWMPDKQFLQLIYFCRLGKRLDLKNPKTFNEKLQWLKLYDRKLIYTTMVDKYGAKKYIEDKIGEEYIIPTLGVWDRFEDIDFDNLPKQFVLKCTHDSGGLVICRDKSNFDIKEVRKKIIRSLNRNYYMHGREWPYKNVKPRIIAEQYVSDDARVSGKVNQLTDYKFFCFDGEVKAMFVATDRANKSTDTKFDFFDADFNHLDLIQGHPNAPITPMRPVHFEQMKKIAEVLSKGIPQIRVDFYEVGDRLYVGELTFFHFSGLVPFKPEKWDKIFGEWITIPFPKK